MSYNRYLNMEKLTAALFGSEKDGSDNPFQEVTLSNAIVEEDDDKTKALDACLKELSRGDLSAIAREEEKAWSASVHFGACDTKGFQITVRPLLSKRTQDFASDMVFTNLHITQLSEFYVLCVSDSENAVERVLLIPTDGLPEGREKAVVSSVVSDRDCFYRYIAFLLGDDTILSMLESNKLGGVDDDSQNRQTERIPALYEKMLRAAAAAPEKFQGIEYLMKTISEDGIIPDDFKKLYDTFRNCI